MDSGSGLTEEIEEFVSVDECSGLNWGLLWQNIEGEMEGDDCYVEDWGENWGVNNCDCTDPENYIYSAGRFGSANRTYDNL